MTTLDSLYDGLNTIEDVENLISQCVRESEVLEYKTASRPFSDKEKDEIAKDVSAFANSMGGVIIYGVATHTTDKTRPLQREPINQKNIETFDRVINSQIREPIKNIQKKLIPIEQPEVMIIQIPESENTPHQSLCDKKYYRRSGCESLPMEHDLVSMHFGRKHGPILDFEIDVIKSFAKIVTNPEVIEGTFRLFLSNNGKRVARYPNVIIRAPSKELVELSTSGGYPQNIDDLYANQQVRQWSTDSGVIHPGSRTRLFDLIVRISDKNIKTALESGVISWVVFADQMEKRTGERPLSTLGLTA